MRVCIYMDLPTAENCPAARSATITSEEIASPPSVMFIESQHNPNIIRCSINRYINESIDEVIN